MSWRVFVFAVMFERYWEQVAAKTIAAAPAAGEGEDGAAGDGVDDDEAEYVDLHRDDLLSNMMRCCCCCCCCC